MNIKEIKELLKAFDESGSSYLSVNQDGVIIKLKKPSETVTVMSQPTVSVASVPTNASVESTVSQPEIANSDEHLDGEQVLAPLVGVFYAAPSPEAAAYVQVGDTVKKGQILCLIEAMKMMSEITAPKDGVIKKIYVKNQDVVGYEDPLFLIGD